MNIGILFTVRISSSRLPRKALLEVRGIPMISYLIRRFQTLCSERLIICTTTLQEDNYFDIIAAQHDINIFHGNADNILNRHLECAKQYDLDYIVNVDCDDIFSSPELVKKLTEKMPYSDVVYTNGFPFGTNLFAYNVNILNTLPINDNQVDTGWGALIKDNTAFSHYIIEADEREQFDIRLSLDYEEDFLLFRHIIETLDMDKRFVSQNEIISYIKKNPNIAKINSMVD